MILCLNSVFNFALLSVNCELYQGRDKLYFVCCLSLGTISLLKGAKCEGGESKNRLFLVKAMREMKSRVTGWGVYHPH